MNFSNAKPCAEMICIALLMDLSVPSAGQTADRRPIPSATLTDRHHLDARLYRLGLRKRGRLIPTLENHVFQEAGTYAIYPPTRHLSVKICTFVDQLVAHFAPEPHWLMRYNAREDPRLPDGLKAPMLHPS